MVTKSAWAFFKSLSSMASNPTCPTLCGTTPCTCWPWTRLKSGQLESWWPEMWHLMACSKRMPQLQHLISRRKQVSKLAQTQADQHGSVFAVTATAPCQCKRQAVRRDPSAACPMLATPLCADHAQRTCAQLSGHWSVPMARTSQMIK